MSLATKAVEIEKVQITQVPIMIGYSGVRHELCEHFHLDRRYYTEYCRNPEHVESYRSMPLRGGRGIVGGCETCPLFGGKKLEFE